MNKGTRMDVTSAEYAKSFERIFNDAPTSTAEYVTTVRGIPVYKSDAVPHGEVHMVKDGMGVGCIIGLDP